MKKTHLVFASLICLGMSMSSCQKRGQFAGNEQYPQNPVEGQRYVDSHGNSSMWNAALGCWMISSMMNGRSVQHHYYPSTGSYTDSRGMAVSRPNHIPAASSNVSTPSSRSNTSGVGSRSSNPTPAKSAGFGSTGRSSGSSAT